MEFHIIRDLPTKATKWRFLITKSLLLWQQVPHVLAEMSLSHCSFKKKTLFPKRQYLLSWLLFKCSTCSSQNLQDLM